MKTSVMSSYRTVLRSSKITCYAQALNVIHQGSPDYFPHVVTIVLSDFIKARDANSEVPNDATVLCATPQVIARGAVMGVFFYYLTFPRMSRSWDIFSTDRTTVRHVNIF